MKQASISATRIVEFGEFTFKVNIREGATEPMIRETIRHYITAMRAYQKGGREVAEAGQVRTDFGPAPHDEARVQVFPDGYPAVSINRCTERTTAQDLLNILWLVTDATKPEGNNGNSPVSPEDAAQRDFEALGAEPPMPSPGPPQEQESPFRPQEQRAERAGRVADARSTAAGHPPPTQESPFKTPAEREGYERPVKPPLDQPIEGSQRGVKYSEVLASAQRGQMLRFTIVKIARKVTEDGSASKYEFYERYGSKPGQYPIYPKAYTDNDGDMLALQTTLDALNIGPAEAREGKWELLAEVFENDTGKTARPRQLRVIEAERVQEPF